MHAARRGSRTLWWGGQGSALTIGGGDCWRGKDRRWMGHGVIPEIVLLELWFYTRERRRAIVSCVRVRVSEGSLEFIKTFPYYRYSIEILA